jgi:hypothetical protein
LAVCYITVLNLCPIFFFKMLRSTLAASKMLVMYFRFSFDMLHCSGKDKPMKL